MYFILKGRIGYVLPRYNNVIYRVFEMGEHIGHTEFASMKRLTGDYQDKKSHNSRPSAKWKNLHPPVRRFTAQVLEYSELLVLQLADILVMRMEFP